MPGICLCYGLDQLNNQLFLYSPLSSSLVHFLLPHLTKFNTAIDGSDLFMHSEVDGAKAMPIRLPVDEDDYLMPSPGPHAPATGTYMDLIGNTSMGGE